MIKTIFFDLGNVLFFFSHEKMVSQLALCTKLNIELVRKILSTEGILYETGKISSEKIYETFKSHSSHPFSKEEFRKAASDIFISNDLLWDEVKALKKRGLRLIILSNTSEAHFHYLSSNYPLSLFDDRILSYEVGAMKPSEKIFIEALTRADCSPEHCLYIDDIPNFIEGAKRVGLDGFVYTGVPEFKEELKIRGL